MTRPSSLDQTQAGSWIQLLRPRQWVKSFFILPAPLFGLAHSALALSPWLKVAGAFVTFCLVSSAVYILNDVLDVASDRLHPTKRERLIASGRISRGAALAIAGLLLALGLSTAVLVRPALAGIAAAYLANSLAYLMFFKSRVIADVLSIAVGFMLRILAGAVAASLAPSSWLMICGFSLALFLGFCKRRSELELYADQAQAGAVRRVFNSYSTEKLNLLVSITAAVTIVAYMLFTVSPETVQRHGTTQLIYTTPFVVYCILRFLLKTLEQRGEDAAETLFLDPGFLAAGCGWLASVVWVLQTAKAAG